MKNRTENRRHVTVYKGKEFGINDLVYILVSSINLIQIPVPPPVTTGYVTIRPKPNLLIIGSDQHIYGEQSVSRQ